MANVGQTTQRLDRRFKNSFAHTANCAFFCDALRVYGPSMWELRIWHVGQQGEDLSGAEDAAMLHFNSVYPSGYNSALNRDKRSGNCPREILSKHFAQFDENAGIGFVEGKWRQGKYFTLHERRCTLVFPSDQILPSAETVRFPSLHRPLACGQYTYPLFGTRLQIANGSAEGPLERGDAICANRTGGGGTLWGQGGQNRKIVAVLLRSWQRCQPYSQNVPRRTLH